jgi:peroxiredoxin
MSFTLTRIDYRGHWCPFCIAHFKELVAISAEIKAAGGVVAAATAEVPEHLDKFRASTGFSDTVIVDPENLLAKHLKKSELLEVAISDSQLYRLRGYKHGMAQPALLVINRDATVLQRWAIVPSLVSVVWTKAGKTDKANELSDEYWWRHG